MHICFCAFRRLFNQVLENQKVTSDEKARISILQQQQTKSAGAGTDVNKNRKQRICLLFPEFDKLTALIDLYRGKIN